MFLPGTWRVEATEEPHTHTPRRCSKTRQTKENPGEEISIQMCRLRLHEKIQPHTDKERETCKAMSVTLQCNLGVRRCQCSSTWRTTFHPQDSNNADRARSKTATDSQEAHTCNRGGPCQNREGSSVGAAGGSLFEQRMLSVKTAGSSL